MSIRDRFPHIAARYVPDPQLSEADDEPASNYLRAALLDGLREFAPDARVDAFANVHLTGPRFEHGLFERHAADILLRFQNEIDSLTDDAERDSVQIGFQHIEHGSVILLLNPVSPLPADNDQLPMSSPPALETALQRILDLHDAFESGDEGLMTTRATSELATRARQLIESLDDADAIFEVDLSRSNGSRRQSKLTAAGRANANRFFERKPIVEEVDVSGTLRTNSTTGHIELSSGKRVIDVVKVPPEVAKTLQWDIPIRMRVRRTTAAARAGSKPRVENEFVRIVEHREVIPGSNSADTA